jgi:hypothetical protein
VARKSAIGKRAKGGRYGVGGGAVESAMREVHNDTPSTVKRAKHFGPGGKEAMLRAIAFSKARKGK